MERDDFAPVVLGKSQCLMCHWIGVFEGLFCMPCAAKRADKKGDL